jgi:hypothetical protein
VDVRLFAATLLGIRYLRLLPKNYRRVIFEEPVLDKFDPRFGERRPQFIVAVVMNVAQVAYFEAHEVTLF